jgi:hypothetical protein
MIILMCKLGCLSLVDVRHCDLLYVSTCVWIWICGCECCLSILCIVNVYGYCIVNVLNF